MPDILPEKTKQPPGACAEGQDREAVHIHIEICHAGDPDRLGACLEVRASGRPRERDNVSYVRNTR